MSFEKLPFLSAILFLILLLQPLYPAFADYTYDTSLPTCAITFSGTNPVTATATANGSAAITSFSKDGTAITTPYTWTPAGSSNFTATVRSTISGNNSSCSGTYPPTNAPACQVFTDTTTGGSISVQTNQITTFLTSATGNQLNAAALYWSTGSDTSNVYNLMRSVDCLGIDYGDGYTRPYCWTSGGRSFSSPGLYYVICAASNTSGSQCSGAPYYINNGTYPSCGTNSKMNVNVTAAPASAVITPWIQVTGDVHSNTSINAPGGP